MSDWQTENLKGAIALADSTIRSLILVNGAAAVGLLTFYGNHPGLTGAAKTALHGSLNCFGIGVASAVICSIFTYFTQRGIATGAGIKLEVFCTLAAMAATFASSGLFIAGLYYASEGLK